MGLGVIASELQASTQLPLDSSRKADGDRQYQSKQKITHMIDLAVTIPREE